MPGGHAGVVTRAARTEIYNGSPGEDLVVDVGGKFVLQ